MDNTLTFTKMTATGNDFIIVALMDDFAKNEFTGLFSGLSRAAIAKKLCQRNFGLGADGMVILQPASPGKSTAAKAHLKWDFYNSDGSRAEMCGNAARCVARFAHRHNLAPQQMEIQTASGLVGAEVGSENSVTVRMPKVKGFKANQSVKFSRAQIPFHLVNTGVPHAVIEIFSSQREEKLAQLAQKVKSLPRFRPADTNVTFFRKASKNKIYSLTHERGVENFTLSCGTGAVAAAFVFRNLYGGTTETAVEVPGGQLQVSWQEHQPFLTGPAHFIADCFLYPGEIL